jgi:parallel beta-helix repeat protein
MKKIALLLIALMVVCVGLLSGCNEQNNQKVQNEQENKIKNVGINGDYSTIQGAINSANPKDIIKVQSGTYMENIIIDKELTLIGDSRDTTIIDGGNNGNVVTINSNRVNISNFTIRNSNIDKELTSGIYLKNKSYCNVYNNKFNFNYLGIKLENDSNYNKITNNNFSYNYVGIHLTNNILDTIIENNTVLNNNAYGIVVEHSSNYNIIKNNTISKDTHDGITLGWYCDSNTISDNTIFYNENGIYIFNSKSNTITSNEINSSSKYGILLQRANNSIITQNTFSDNILFGIYLEIFSSYNRITNNTIATNNFEYGGISTNETCYDNIIENINYTP